MIMTVGYDMIMAVKIYSCVMGNYFTVSFLLSVNKHYILFCSCSANKFVLWVRCLIDAFTLLIHYDKPENVN